MKSFYLNTVLFMRQCDFRVGTVHTGLHRWQLITQLSTLTDPDVPDVRHFLSYRNRIWVSIFDHVVKCIYDKAK